MAKDWDYAKMSQEAAKAGGPAAWIEMIKKTAYENGKADMKNKIAVPLLFAGVGIGTIATVGYQKIEKWISDKKKEKTISEQEAMLAEVFLKRELGEVIQDVSLVKEGEEENEC